MLKLKHFTYKKRTRSLMSIRFMTKRLQISMLFLQLRLENQKFSNANYLTPLTLHIQISTDTLKQFVEHVEAVRFMESFSNNATSAKIEIENGSNTSIQYLSGTKDWYQFSIELHHHLSEYPIHANPNKFNAAALVEIVNGLIKNNSEILFKDSAIQKFVDRVKPAINAGMENITVNQVKLKSLYKLLQRSVLFPIATSCTANELVVKGYNIKMIDVGRV